MKKTYKAFLVAAALALLPASMPAQTVDYPAVKQPGVATITENGDTWVLGNELLSASFAREDGKLLFKGCPALDLLASNELFRITSGSGSGATISNNDMTLGAVTVETLNANSEATRGVERIAGKQLKAVFTNGTFTVNWYAVLRNDSHYLRTYMEISSSSDVAMKSITSMLYNVSNANGVPATSSTRYAWGSMLTTNTIFAGLETPMGKNTVVSTGASTAIQGLWERPTTLDAGEVWTLGAVVGHIPSPDQARRSVLAYVERERAVPWRSHPIYNSWYEINIGDNNASDPKNNMNKDQCVTIVNAWKEKLFDEQGVKIKSFVWDDGWDNYADWGFHGNFPNGFAETKALCPDGVGQGVWLAPVGGYGTSGDTRRKNWSSRGGMQLSNPEYRGVFVGAVENLVKNHGVNFFKFDGLSDDVIAVGPDADLIKNGNSATAIESIEEFLSMNSSVREILPDVYINATVGTWASPFWYRFADATWRQEYDWGQIGNEGSVREKWITYRDNHVYDNYVATSPLTPINNLMTHGLIITDNENANFDGKKTTWYGVTTYENKFKKELNEEEMIREMRCAFACGSGMVELYVDHDIMTQHNLWDDLAECIKWHEGKKNVMADVHWVGGDPWDGSKVNVYGWAAWNTEESMLALRNPSTSAKSFTFTLREAFNIPEYVTGTITLSDAFSTNQASISALKGKTINIDDEITISIPASTVVVYDGVNNSEIASEGDIEAELAEAKTEALALVEGISGGIGYPNDNAIAEYINAVNNATSKDAIEAAKNALYATTSVNMPEDGKAYRIKAKYSNGTVRYVYDNGTKLQVSESEPSGYSGTFIFRSLGGGEYALVNNDGEYMVYYADGKSGAGSVANGLAASFELGAQDAVIKFVPGKSVAITSGSDSGNILFGTFAMQAFNSSKDGNGMFYMMAGAPNFHSSGAADAYFTENRSSFYVLEEAAYPNTPYLNAIEGEMANSISGYIATFSAPFATVAPEGVKVYYAADGGNDYVTLKLIDSAEALPANHGYILVGNSIGNTTMLPAAGESAASIDVNYLGHSAGADKNFVSDGMVYLLGNRNGEVGFYRNAAGVLAMNKAYLDLGSAAAKSITVRFGGTTDIEYVNDDAGEEVIYDLCGRRVENPGRGIYIVNGKKVFFK